MPQLPSGTVTFLFTDIEGSTKRWDEARQQMSDALQQHDALLTRLIEHNGGFVFKTVGDAFCAAFSTPLDALEAALSAQSHLAHELPGIKVRVALHTGMSEERGGDYFGPTLNRVARLLSAGHGGQTLLSGPTYDLVRDYLPAGVSLLDMGEHHLKDLTRPEHVFQLVASGLPFEFPPLKTLDSRPNNLPRQATQLIGREKETAAVCALLSRQDVQVVTLTGPGGTGKTRLALQVAADMLDDLSDGVFFVNLAPITDHSLVISTIAQTLAVKEAGGQLLIDTLKGYLKEKRLLLVLDNFEQVVEAAPFVAQLAADCSHIKIMTTSRVPLRVRGEKEYPVPPLSLPNPYQLPSLEHLTQYEAVRMFIERAVDVKPDFEVNNENAPAVAEICVRLDGLPLAIELAAARIRLFPPQALLTRLSSRLKLLTGGARDASTRQQTLRGAIDWSYDLLNEGEKQLFRRLAVFQGGRTFEAMEAVCNANGDLQVDVFDGVESLVGKSLLQQEEGVGGEPRFVMLETIHEYTREKLEDSGEKEALRREHAGYFLGMAEEAHDRFDESERPEWLDRLETDHDNLRAAMVWAEETGQSEIALRLVWALRHLWVTRGYFGEGREHVAAALVIDHKAKHTLARARALHAQSSLAWVQSDTHISRVSSQDALEIFRELGDKRGMALSLQRLASAAGYQGDHVAEARLGEEALELYRQLDRKTDLANQLVNLGCAINANNGAERGRALIEEGYALFKELGSKNGMGFALENLGEVAHQQGDYKSALKLWEESVSLYRAMGNKRWISIGLCYAAAMKNRLHGPEQAIPLFRESLLLAQEIGYKHGIADCLSGLAGVATSQVRPERAARLLAAAEGLLAAMGNAFYSTDRIEHDRSLAAARAQLDDATWRVAWEEGRAMDMEQAIVYALEETPGE